MVKRTRAQAEYDYQRNLALYERYKKLAEKYFLKMKEDKKIIGSTSLMSDIINMLKNSLTGTLTLNEVRTNISDLDVRTIKKIFMQIVLENKPKIILLSLIGATGGLTLVDLESEELEPSIYRFLINTKGNIFWMDIFKQFPNTNPKKIKQYIKIYCKYVEPNRVIKEKATDKKGLNYIERKN